MHCDRVYCLVNIDLGCVYFTFLLVISSRRRGEKETICAQTYIPFDRSHFFCIAPDAPLFYDTSPSSTSMEESSCCSSALLSTSLMLSPSTPSHPSDGYKILNETILTTSPPTKDDDNDDTNDDNSSSNEYYYIGDVYISQQSPLLSSSTVAPPPLTAATAVMTVPSTTANDEQVVVAQLLLPTRRIAAAAKTAAVVGELLRGYDATPPPPSSTSTTFEKSKRERRRSLRLQEKPSPLLVRNDFLANSNSISNQQKQQELITIVQQIYNQPYSWCFRQPVDTIVVPDYNAVISNPIDLSIILTRITTTADDDKYNKENLYNDLQLMINNCKLYNGSGNVYYDCAVYLEKYMDTIFSNMDEEQRSRITDEVATTKLMMTHSFPTYDDEDLLGTTAERSLHVISTEKVVLDKENSSNSTTCSTTTDDDEQSCCSSKRKKRKRRRDTFDLRKGKRCCAVVATSSSTTTTDDTRSSSSRHNFVNLKVAINNDDDMELVSSTSNSTTTQTANQDYTTPKAGSVVEVNAERISKTFHDHRVREEVQEEAAAIDKTAIASEYAEENIMIQCNIMEHLTSSAIEERMKDLFSTVTNDDDNDRTKQIYYYPCVSARIFAAMSLVYANQVDFSPLLTLLQSFVDAELMSLSKIIDPFEQTTNDEILFVNKKVCFSGYDCSSTMTTMGTVVGQGCGDMKPNVDILVNVLSNVLDLPRPVYYLNVAIRCLECMSSTCSSNDNNSIISTSNNDMVSDACAKTMVAYYPSSRFGTAIKHYVDEFKDIKCFVTSSNNTTQQDALSSLNSCDVSNRSSIEQHTGVRYRLNDFIGRTIRYHLREMLNSISTYEVEFNVDKCEDRWGRAVDDRSISSIMNFALLKFHELIMFQPNLFVEQEGIDTMSTFFSSEASMNILSLSKDDLKQMDKTTFDDLVMDLTEARKFLLGARACKFLLELLTNTAISEHITTNRGWGSVEAMASTFYKLNLHEGSDNGHFVHLRSMEDLITVSWPMLSFVFMCILFPFCHSYLFDCPMADA